MRACKSGSSRATLLFILNISVLIFTERVNCTQDYTQSLTLAFELRQKARLKTKSDSGEDIGLMLPRGQILRGGDCLRTDEGIVAKVIAAKEKVSIATSNNKLLLAKASYHLGNRHMPLQIEEEYLVYLRDHVLDEMVRSLGLSVAHKMQVFEPESGAYHQHEHAH